MWTGRAVDPAFGRLQADGAGLFWVTPEQAVPVTKQSDAEPVKLLDAGRSGPMFTGTPTLVDRVAIGTGRERLTGAAIVLGARVGATEPLWRRPVARSPVIGFVARVRTGHAMLSLLGTGPQTTPTVQRIDTRTGRVIWSRDLPGFANTHHIAGNTIVIGMVNSGLAAYTLSDGERLWSHRVQGPYTTALVGRHLAVVTRGSVQLLRSDDGTLVTRASVPGAVHQGIVVSSERLFVFGAPVGNMGSRRVTEVIALDAATLAVRWRAKLPYPIDLPAVYFAGHLVTCSAGGALVAIEPARGRLVWRRDLAGGCRLFRARVGRRLAIGTNGPYATWSVYEPAASFPPSERAVISGVVTIDGNPGGAGIRVAIGDHIVETNAQSQFRGAIRSSGWVRVRVLHFDPPAGRERGSAQPVDVKLSGVGHYTVSLDASTVRDYD